MALSDKQKSDTLFLEDLNYKKYLKELQTVASDTNSNLNLHPHKNKECQNRHNIGNSKSIYIYYFSSLN